MQKLKVFLLRWFYRWSNRRAWSNVNLLAVNSKDFQIPGAEGKIAARRYQSTAGERNSLIIYLHGGGWILGDLETHDPFCRRLATETGASVLALDYRCAPEHPFPAAALDCIAATQWILTHRAELAVDDTSVFIAGDSAGGNLAAVVANHLSRNGDSGLRGQLLIVPVVRHYQPYPASYIENAKGYGLTKSLMEWFWDTYLAGVAPDADGAISELATPLFEPLPETLPPALVITAGLDPLRDEGAEYVARLAQAGISCGHQLSGPEMHGLVCSEGLTDGHVSAMRLITQWIDVQNTAA
jgi:acetyl esterase